MQFRPPRKSIKIIELLTEAGASDCLFVGGCVRDFFLGIESKDIDIEVYGLDYDKISSVLSKHFRVDLVGQSFGVIKVDNVIDVGIPRRESKIGIGHTGFHVETDSTLTPEEAFGRRDFTINAIGMRLDGSVCDPYGGHKDLCRKILRATTDSFGEDPLRVLRGMQFTARFGFDADNRTLELCRSLLPEFETLASERIWTEWYKWAVKGKYLSKGLQFLRDCGWIEKFPEINALVGCLQNPHWHPEGDVFVHTQHACNEAVKLADEYELDDKDRAILVFATLCHDFGKPPTTYLSDKGHWVSPGHAGMSGPLAEIFLERMRAPKWLIEQVVPLAVEHMAHNSTPETEIPHSSVVRRLATRLDPATIKMWGLVCQSDSRGCGGLKDRRNRVQHWLEVADQLAVSDAKPIPLLFGRDLLTLNMQPGPKMGKILKAAYEAQLDGVIKTKEEAIQWVNEHVFFG